MMVKIENIEKEDYTELIVSGEVDASSSIYLDEALGKAIKGHSKILINLTGLEYISSAGLGVFMSYIDEIGRENINMCLYGMNESVSHIFEILGIDQLLKISETEIEAINSINETPA